MENSPVTVSVSLKKDINSCTATVPDQSLGDNSYIFYKFESANYGNVTIGEEVYDGNTKLTLKTDYEMALQALLKQMNPVKRCLWRLKV